MNISAQNPPPTPFSEPKSSSLRAQLHPVIDSLDQTAEMLDRTLELIQQSPETYLKPGANPQQVEAQGKQLLLQLEQTSLLYHLASHGKEKVRQHLAETNCADAYVKIADLAGLGEGDPSALQQPLSRIEVLEKMIDWNQVNQGLRRKSPIDEHHLLDVVPNGTPEGGSTMDDPNRFLHWIKNSLTQIQQTNALPQVQEIAIEIRDAQKSQVKEH